MSIDLKPEQHQAFEIIREQLDLEDWMFEQREAIAAHVEALPRPRAANRSTGMRLLRCCGGGAPSG